MWRTSLAIALAGTMLVHAQGPPAPSPTQGQNLADQSLEQLLNVQVTSVGKKSQALKTAAASVFVITSEDIRRSGMHTVPDLLRLAPGVQVARVETGAWAISVRGFNDQYANKLLVLVDGRSVYNEAYGGVYWDMLDTGVEEIDRIEVIRGPAAAIWGPNAVNGVINILTKPASATQGGSATAVAGSGTEAGAFLRYGGTLGTHADYRVTGSSATYAPLTSDGLNPTHGWTRDALGFRMDWTPDAADSVTVSGQGMESTAGHLAGLITPSNPFPAPQDLLERSYDGNILGSWRHTFANGASLEARGSYERVQRADMSVPLDYSTTEGELKYHAAIGSRQDLIAGIDLRASDYRMGSGGVVQMNPAESKLGDESVFVQDEIKLVSNRLSFIAGAYMGTYSFTGFQIQPTGRLLWTPSRKVSVWAAVSRAVRTPALLDLSISATLAAAPEPPLVGIVRLVGNPKYVSEPTTSYETGQRLEISRRLSLDFSQFYTVYHRLDSEAPMAPAVVNGGATSPTYIDIAYQIQNGSYGRAYGGEAVASWTATRRWTLSGGYSRLHLATYLYAPAPQTLGAEGAGGSPANQWDGRSHLDITRRLEWDAAFYYTGRMTAMNTPADLRGDTHLSWRAGEHLVFTGGVEDGLNPTQAEYYSARLLHLTQVHRNVFGTISWTF